MNMISETPKPRGIDPILLVVWWLLAAAFLVGVAHERMKERLAEIKVSQGVKP